MDAPQQMRESFLRELMLLQEREEKEKADNSEQLDEQTQQHQTTRKTAPTPTKQSPVNVTFFSDSGAATGRTLCGSFVACDTNLTHIIVNNLITPVGKRSSALIRLSDVIAISYC